MPTIRLSLIGLWLAVLAISIAAPALADMCYYRDARGQLHLTNVRARIAPAYRARADRNRRLEGSRMSVSPSTPGTRLTKAEPASPPRGATALAPRARVLPASAPVNTRQFGLLQLGMSDNEVLRCLGPPATINDAGERAVGGFPHGTRIRRIVRGEIWYYAGTSRVEATSLEFFNGVLVRKTKEPR